MDIDDAIEAAAGDRESQISADVDRAARSSRTVSRARNTIARFLEAVPDELTVFELREMLSQRAI